MTTTNTRAAFACALLMCALAFAARAPAQQAATDGDDTARALLESAAQAMGGRERLEALDNFVMTGFGQYLNQEGGSRVTGHPMAPAKWQAANAVERSFDLRNKRALNRDRRAFEFPFAARFGQSWSLGSQVQTGTAMLNHPLPALLEALDPGTALGPVRVEDGLSVVELTTAQGDVLWLAIEPATSFPAWVRWITGSTTLGDVTYTTWFTGYLPFDGVRLPVGLTTVMDWRDTVAAELHVDSYRLNVDALPEFPQGGASGGFGGGTGAEAEATEIAQGVWDVRVGGNGGAVVEFADHLTMFEAYGNEAATFARIDLANTLVPGKEVTEVIVSHHHFDHSGGLRAAVSRGLSVIAHRGNEQIFREMVARPAPNYPDALARNPQPLKLVPVDEHLVLEDETMRVDVYHAIGHVHMANAVFAYIPEHRIFLEGDFSTHDWDWHWWGGAYLDNVEHYGLDPALNIPVHGIVTTFEETLAAIEEQVQRAREFCDERAAVNVFPAGCPVKYSRDAD
jgi:glyoxylase-like metal-dependent hydrolase (beta-lactamase superfamily II)